MNNASMISDRKIHDKYIFFMENETWDSEFGSFHEVPIADCLIVPLSDGRGTGDGASYSRAHSPQHGRSDTEGRVACQQRHRGDHRGAWHSDPGCDQGPGARRDSDPGAPVLQRRWTWQTAPGQIWQTVSQVYLNVDLEQGMVLRRSLEWRAPFLHLFALFFLFLSWHDSNSFRSGFVGFLWFTAFYFFIR